MGCTRASQGLHRLKLKDREDIFRPKLIAWLDMEVKRGEKTRIVAGPFKDIDALILNVDPERDMVRVEIDFSGRKTRIELSPSLLEAPILDPLSLIHI